MGTSTQDIFGAGAAGVPATPGSYGEAPPDFRLPEATHTGAVHVQVADLERSLQYYRDVLGLQLREQPGHHAALAALGDGEPLLVLHERHGAAPVRRRGQLGLFHFAILLPSRAALGQFVRHLATLGVPAGAGDHLVSEAFYLSDPDGLGIEVYADRPRESWRRVGRELMMATDPVDVEGLRRDAEGGVWKGMPAAAVMGHVHLHVGDIPRASAFYSDALGFDRMVWSYPGALFLGAGGYHHHLGTNTWAGPGAKSPAEDDARLIEWTLVVPDAGALERVAASLEGKGYAAERAADGSVATRDPWDTQVRVREA